LPRARHEGRRGPLGEVGREARQGVRDRLDRARGEEGEVILRLLWWEQPAVAVGAEESAESASDGASGRRDEHSLRRPLPTLPRQSAVAPPPAARRGPRGSR